MTKISKESKIYIAGHKGMVGSACWRLFKKEGYFNLIGKSSKELDLRNQNEVKNFFEHERPEVVIDAAARVGGIWVNNEYPYEFLMDNMLIQNNLIRTAHDLDVEKFVFLGSSCIYPKMAPQPLKEKYLLTGPLEETNQWYAIAKISGVKLIEAIRREFKKDFVSVMPTNLYGPNDNYDENSSHVLPALLRKIYKAKTENLKNIELWGNGKPLREFLHVDDLAEAILIILNTNTTESIYNVGSGDEISISNLAKLIKEKFSYEGEILWNISKPNGTPRKLLNSSKIIKLGWKNKISLEDGIEDIIKKNDFI